MRVKEAKDEVPKEHVDTFFSVFSNRLYEIPHSVRPEIVRLLRQKSYNQLEDVIKLDKTDPNMYFIVEGNAMMFYNQISYQKFLNATDKAKDEKDTRNQLA